MERLRLIQIFLLISLILLFFGMFAEKGPMKLSAASIMFLTVLSFYLTWIQPSYLSRKTVLSNLSSATSYAFLFLSVLAGLILILDTFIIPVTNMNFAIFSSIFISTIVARMYVAKEVSEYI